MGSPASNQMLGSAQERLAELACRICYDSLGNYADGKPRGRSSALLHEHIKEVKHYSTIEHVWLSFTFKEQFRDMLLSQPEYAFAMLNRKGLWTNMYFCKSNAVRNPVISCNLRTIVEWDLYSHNADGYAYTLGQELKNVAKNFAPHIVDNLNSGFRSPEFLEIVVPSTEDDIFVSAYLRGSRCFSHEMVRHREAISQRSGRYCDENDSPLLDHPAALPIIQNDLSLDQMIGSAKNIAQHVYCELSKKMESTYLAIGMDKTSARKIARGASRYYLPNGLETAMIYTTSIAGWKWILNQRMSDPADPEIRLVMNDLFTDIMKSSVAKYFEHLDLVPAKDNIGFVLTNWKGSDLYVNELYS